MGSAGPVVLALREFTLGAGMFCPLCKAEYRESFTRCADCDVELIPALPPLDDNAALVLWHGDDLVLFSRIVSDLQAAGIPHCAKTTSNHLAEGIFRPGLEILVMRSHLAAAQQVVSDLLVG